MCFEVFFSHFIQILTRDIVKGLPTSEGEKKNEKEPFTALLFFFTNDSRFIIDSLPL